MKKQEDLDHTIENVFEAGGQPVPEDRYFKKIWNSIEIRAPVGEKYYLRWIFSAFFIILFLGVVGLFYSDFLSSVLTLKELRRENASLFTGSTTRPSPFYGNGGIDVRSRELLPGLTVTALEKEWPQLKSHGHEQVELNFQRGHVLIHKEPQVPPVIIYLPDLKLTLHGGKLNLFCYDGIIRVIPVAEPVEIEYKARVQTINPGKTFYLLDGQVTWR